MTEQDTQQQILIALGHGDCRLFRTNAGHAWQGEIVQRTPQLLTLHNYRGVKLGPDGYADIHGLVSVDPRTVAHLSVIALPVAIEVKYGRRKPTDEQRAYLNVFQSMGGRAGVAYTIADAQNIIYPR